MERSISPHEIFRALANPARVQIVRELSGGAEKCVSDLVDACGLSWSTVSRHLSVMREAGVLAAHKRGLQVFYRIALPCVSRFVDCLENPGRYPELERTGTCCR